MTNSIIPAEGVGAPSTTSAFFRWDVPEKPVSVDISLDVIDRLEREVIESFKAVTKRGSEIGGILLGRSARAAKQMVTIESYQTVECDYSRGPLYLLSEADKRRLEGGMASVRTSPAGLSVVGFFRSNTRRDLALDDEDLAIIGEYFSKPENAFLLVKPFAMKPSVAGFFFWEGGKVHGESTYQQFPFRRSELVKGWAQAIVDGGAPPPAAPQRDERLSPVMAPRREDRAPVAPPPQERPEAAAPKPEPPRPEPVKAETPVAPAPRIVPRPATIEVRSPQRPTVPVRTEAPPPPPQPVARREEPAAPPPVKEEPPAITAKREDRPAPPLAFKREDKPTITPAPPKPQDRAPMPSVTVRREERPAPPPPKPEPQIRKVERPGPQPVAKETVTVKETPAAPPPVKKEEKPPAQVVPAKVEAPAKPAETPAPAIKAETATVIAEPAPGAVSRVANNKWLWLAVIVLLAGAGAAVKFLNILSPAPSAKSEDATLGLKVDRNAGQFMLTWNRNAPLIQTAQRATLSISDGDHNEDVDLDLGQLKSGSIVYSPMTNDVSFRLEVTDLKKGKSLSESVRWLAGRPSPSVPMPQGQQVVMPPPAAAPSTMPATQAAKPGEQLASLPVESAPAQPAPSQLVPPPAMASSPTSEPPKPPPVVTAQPVRPDSLAARLSAPPASMAEPPALEGSSGSLSSALPMRSMAQAPPPPKEAPKPAVKIGGNVVEAKLIPSSRVLPNYPVLARQARVSGSVKVQATIGADGRVRKAVALAGPPLLRQAATEAVMRWRYEPSRLNGQAVESTTEVDVGFNLGR